MNETDLNVVLGLIKEARLWMQAEKNRNSSVRMRQDDWQFLIARLQEAEQIIDPPKE